MTELQKNLNDLLKIGRKKTYSKSENSGQGRVCMYEEFKQHYPDRVEIAKALIVRLERNQRPHAREQATHLDWWDARLQATIAPTYMEKRQRQQVIRGLLRECGIKGIRSSNH